MLIVALLIPHLLTISYVPDDSHSHTQPFARRGLQTTSSFYRWGTEAQEEEVTCQVGGRAKTGFRLMQLIVKPTNIHVHIQGMDVGAAGRREDKLQPGPDCQ